MKNPQLLALALPLMAAAPLDRPITLTVPSDSTISLSAPSPSKGVPNFAPAPLPNRELAPTTDRASTEPTLGPTLFTSRTQFRGDGFSPGSTAQGDQEHRAKPAAGFSLHMPMTSQ